MTELKFSENALVQIKQLLSNPVFDEFRRREAASRARNDVTADWLSNFMNRMQNNVAPGAPIDAKTGRPHTVESMVEELRERVRLDSLTKQAGLSTDFPLSAGHVAQASVKKKLTEEERNHLREQIQGFIEDLFSSHRGYIDGPAIIHECRTKFGNETATEFAEQIENAVQKAREKFNPGNSEIVMPSSPYMGQPERADPTSDMFFPLFEHVKNL